MSAIPSLWQEEVAPYVRPTMADVRATPWNGLSCVGSFSGCGGSSLGLRIAGWRVPYAIEFVPAAADTYEANSSAYVDRRDVRQIQPHEILDRLDLFRGQLDLLEGSPPCSSFSTAGHGSQGWGKIKKYSDTTQQTDDLFFQFARLLDGLRPRAFIAENVPGMLRNAAGQRNQGDELEDGEAIVEHELVRSSALQEYGHKITEALGEIGYRVDAQVLNAANYGVPQARQRLIFVGFREDQGVWPDLRTIPKVPRVTLAQALAAADPASLKEMEEISMERYAVGRTWHFMRDAGLIGTSGGQNKGFAPDCARCGERLDTNAHHDVVMTGGNFIKSAKCADGQKAIVIKLYNLLVVPDENQPCPTITATGSQVGAASCCHPTECRKFTVAEARSISSFPPDFILTGTRQQQYERIGRAVPPLFMAAVGRYVAERLSSVE